MITAAPQLDSLCFETAQVADAMPAGLISCASETPLRAVAALMTRNRVHAVYVFDYGHEDDETTLLWGLVSDLDIAAAARKIDDWTAGDSAVTPLVTVNHDDRLEWAAQLMAEKGVSHLAVLDPRTRRRPVGVLSTLDVARVVCGA